MSYLQKMVDGGKPIENGSKAMHIKVPYSLATEAAKYADLGKALEGWKAAATGDRYIITSPAGEEAEVLFLSYSDDHCDTQLLRELAQALVGEG